VAHKIIQEHARANEGGNSVDPISVVLAALAAGATAATQDTASQAVKDAYAGLKALLKKRFEKKPQAEMALAEYEKDPNTWQKPLQKSLVEAEADQDEAIIRQAQQVLKLVNLQQASQGKYNMQIGEGKGIVIGDDAQVVQQFYEASQAPASDKPDTVTITRLQALWSENELKGKGIHLTDVLQFGSKITINTKDGAMKNDDVS
jgi:TPR repeat protein